MNSLKMNFKIKDPGSAITHFIGLVFAILMIVPLLLRASAGQDAVHMLSMVVFICSMIMLYAASTIYHTLDISEDVNRRLRKFDHMSIYILIAGSYTPICLISLKGNARLFLCGAVWACAAIGIAVNAFWINVPKWLASVIYIGMGWMVVFEFSAILHALTRPAFLWLLAGGIIYTAGGIIYALKLPIFNTKHKNFGSHEIFHLFVMGGSFCHFILMFCYLA